MVVLVLLRKVKTGNGGSSRTEIALTPASLKWSVALIVFNALCGPTLGVGAYQWALNVNNLPAGIVLAVVAVSPLLIIPFAMKFEGERPSLRSVLGSVVAVIGVIIMTSLVAP